MWDSIGKVRENKDDMDLLPAHRNNDPKFAKKSISNAALINVDFSSSTKGLFSGIKHFSFNLYSLSYFYSAYIFKIIQSKFSGILLFSLATTGFIVFSVISHDPDRRDHAAYVNDSFELLILVIMTVICVWVSIIQIS